MGQQDREACLRDVWAAVLGASDIKSGDNFFDLGGDSIKAKKLIAEARQRGVVVTLTQVFECESLGELAAVAEDLATR